MSDQVSRSRTSAPAETRAAHRILGAVSRALAEPETCAGGLLARVLPVLGLLLGVVGLPVALRPALAASTPPAARPSPAAREAPSPRSFVRIEVDATDAPRRIFHARLTIPARPGPLTLVYPKWLPGEHAPTGPVADLAGLRLTAGGAPLAWRRDAEDMYAFHCDVPAGASAVDVRLDYLSPPATEGFSSSASASAELAVISWNQVLLYPKGARTDDLTYEATLSLPLGWKHATSLPARREPLRDAAGGGASATIEFAPVSLTTLVDSPVLAGAHFRDVPLTSGAEAPVLLHIAADSDTALEISPDLTERYRRLVAEANALFGARHYRSYHFLLSLSEVIAHFGLEHHESSDDRSYERALIDDAPRTVMAGLLAHEMVHSWNGKYRRPAGLATADFQQPMQGELLWVYEGLTNYLGNVLSARSGLRTPEEYRENLALMAATLDQRSGRTWRPLADTAIAAQILYEARKDWSDWRRGTDFYSEGDLIWLEADTLIRRQSGGRRSLDDFCRRFHGSPSGPPAVKPYTFEDVVAAMNEVVAYDWRTFFTKRLTSTEPHAPLGGIEGSGWRLVYVETVPGVLKAIETTREITDVSYSIGLSFRKEGEIADVVLGLPAARAGLGPGMKVIAVNGRKWSPKILRDAIRATKTSSGPIELLVQNAEMFTSYRVDYHGGERYPQMERDTARPDLLSGILKPITYTPAPPAPAKAQ